MSDSRGGSGFSFVDWCADLSGIALASGILAKSVSVRQLATSFRVDDFLPDLGELPEDLTSTKFAIAFGSKTDARFLRLDSDIRKRIKRLWETKESQDQESR
jgi:hypothetical protein